MKGKNRTKRRNLINKKVLHNCSKHSGLVKFAMRELELCGYTKDSTGIDALMRDNLIELLTVFAEQGHSGFSASYAINMFKKLANYETIAPLTFKEDEWNEPFTSDDIRQNRRNSKFFKYADGSISYLDAYCHRDIQRFVIKDNGTREFEEGSRICSSGAYLFEMNNNVCTGRVLHQVRLRKEDELGPYSPKEIIVIDNIEVEFAKDDWAYFFFKDNPKVRELEETYDVRWRYVPFLEEIPIFDYNKEIEEKVYNYLKEENESKLI